MKGPEMKPVSHRTKLISFSNIPILCQMPNTFLHTSRKMWVSLW